MSIAARDAIRSIQFSTPVTASQSSSSPAAMNTIGATQGRQLDACRDHASPLRDAGKPGVATFEN